MIKYTQCCGSQLQFSANSGIQMRPSRSELDNPSSFILPEGGDSTTGMSEGEGSFSQNPATHPALEVDCSNPQGFPLHTPFIHPFRFVATLLALH